MTKKIGIFTIYFYSLIDPYWGIHTEEKLLEIGFGWYNLIINWGNEDSWNIH